MANKTTQYSDQELQDLIYQSSSFTDLARKIGYNTKSGGMFKVIQREIEERGLEVTFQKKVSIQRNPENVFIENSTASQRTLRTWYEKGDYSEYKCSICGQPPKWNGKDLTLILDHINGRNTDDRIENLRWICPNCDMQLDTHGAKNIGNGSIV